MLNVFFTLFPFFFIGAMVYSIYGAYKKIEEKKNKEIEKTDNDEKEALKNAKNLVRKLERNRSTLTPVELEKLNDLKFTLAMKDETLDSIYEDDLDDALENLSKF